MIEKEELIKMATENLYDILYRAAQTMDKENM